MSDNDPTAGVRKRLYESIQETNDLHDEVEGSVLIGFIVIAEWSDPEGRRWLTECSGTAGGDEAPAQWTVDGYLTSVMKNRGRAGG